MKAELELQIGSVIRVEGSRCRVTDLRRGRYTPFKLTVELEEVDE